MIVYQDGNRHGLVSVACQGKVLWQANPESVTEDQIDEAVAYLEKQKREVISCIDELLLAKEIYLQGK